MAKKSDNLLVVSGNQDLLRNRFIRVVQKSASDKGFVLDQSSSAQLSQKLGGSMFFGSNKKLILVSDPEHGDLDLYEDHYKTGDGSTILLLNVAGNLKGNTKFGKFVKSLHKNQHKEFRYVGVEWKDTEFAETWIVKEARRRGLSLSSKLAKAIVQRVGYDVGILSFEMDKIEALVGEGSITPRAVKQALAPLVEGSIGPMFDYLGLRKVKRLSKALTRFRRTSKYDPTMRLCRTLGPTVVKWYQAAFLLEQGIPSNDAADMIQANSWYFINRLVPSARAWGSKRLILLIQALAKAERSVLEGALNPWVEFECLLLALAGGAEK